MIVLQPATPVPIPLGPLSFSFSYLLALSIRIGIAFALTIVIGAERARDAHSAGLRTFPLVAVASCAYVLLTIAVFGPTSEAGSRMLAGLVTAVGFVGGGAIIKDEQRVRGTATAAGIWTTSAIGAAAGYGQFEIAGIVAVITYLTLRTLRRFEPSVQE
ncbi:MAG: MgtC/SapB family protein [Gemmatimonadaceae bacterium]